MKKLILLLIILTSFTNVSYASFPVTEITTFTNVSYSSFPISDTLPMKKDTLQTETVEQYHLRMQKMGFDIDDCRCDDCKIFKGINAPLKNGETRRKQKTNYKSLFVTMGVWIIVIIILLFVWIVRGFMNYDISPDLLA